MAYSYSHTNSNTLTLLPDKTRTNQDQLPWGAVRYNNPSRRPFGAFASCHAPIPPPLSARFCIPPEEAERKRKNDEWVARQLELYAMPGAAWVSRDGTRQEEEEEDDDGGEEGSEAESDGARGMTTTTTSVPLKQLLYHAFRAEVSRGGQRSLLLFLQHVQQLASSIASSQRLRPIKLALLVVATIWVLGMGVLYAAEALLEEDDGKLKGELGYVLVPDFKSWSVAQPQRC
ncbi:Uu.00g067330.m01.CDS01 [Anthostomella pinea]|uniref:Uu.00g067330.m01.CDS01 n=1 Tax=Anthostomella pinea TaxID=933095 RepID=A0AAI8VU46_9PEZI|nr:Uu.00g067330.m01.CDS01 [Anthostomella pinea]